MTVRKVTTYCRDKQHARCRGFRGKYGRGVPKLACECPCHAAMFPPELANGPDDHEERCYLAEMESLEDETDALGLDNEGVPL